MEKKWRQKQIKLILQMEIKESCEMSLTLKLNDQCVGVCLHVECFKMWRGVGSRFVCDQIEGSEA